MKGTAYLIMLCALLAGQPGHAATAVFGSSAETRNALKLTPPAGKAIIYIYRRTEDGDGVSPTIWLNNYEIGRLVPGSFSVWRLAPGQMNLRVEGLDPARLALIAEAGMTYVVRLSVTRTADGPVATLTDLPPSYRSEMETGRWLKNPRELKEESIAATPEPPQKTSPPVSTETVKEEPPTEKRAPVTKTTAGSKSGYALLLRTGALTLSEETQRIVNVDRRFDDSASGIYGIELNYEMGDGLAVGGELLGYTAEFTTVGSTNKHDVDVTAVMVNVKQYFRTKASLQPYIAAGLGLAVTDITGPDVAGNTAGFAYQLIAGVEYRTADFGLFGEYKYLSADTEDDNNESVDVSGSGLFAGVAFHF